MYGIVFGQVPAPLMALRGRIIVDEQRVQAQIFQYLCSYKVLGNKRTVGVKASRLNIELFRSTRKEEHRITAISIQSSQFPVKTVFHHTVTFANPDLSDCLCGFTPHGSYFSSVVSEIFSPRKAVNLSRSSLKFS